MSIIMERGTFALISMLQVFVSSAKVFENIYIIILGNHFICLTFLQNYNLVVHSTGSLIAPVERG